MCHLLTSEHLLVLQVNTTVQESVDR